MSWWLLVTPVIGALAGWILAALLVQWVLVRGIPRRQQQLAVWAGEKSLSLLPLEEIKVRLLHPDNVQKILPEAEVHIDEFLRHKLVKSMPVVGMFVGDKTIQQLKGLFMAELEQLFPVIMHNYLGNLEKDLAIGQMVSQKIAAVPAADIISAIKTMLKKEIFFVKLSAALLGLFIGLVQLLILLLQKP
ncbi:MAG TPA: hypothetical protein VL307_19990 [Chitinophagaceae bacterium]|nr:hypothetical protein [Chitinophagaceae bacterium]